MTLMSAANVRKMLRQIVRQFDGLRSSTILTIKCRGLENSIVEVELSARRIK